MTLICDLFACCLQLPRLESFLRPLLSLLDTSPQSALSALLLAKPIRIGAHYEQKWKGSPGNDGPDQMANRMVLRDDEGNAPKVRSRKRQDGRGAATESVMSDCRRACDVMVLTMINMSICWMCDDSVSMSGDVCDDALRRGNTFDR